jgi:stage II sporulation protein Q
VKILKNISKEKAQRILFITVLILVFGVFFISLSLLGPKDNKDPKDNDPIINGDEDDDDDDDNNVVYELIKTPYSSSLEVKVIRKYWSLEQSTEDQEMSLINYGSQYFLSKGVSYAAATEEEFNVCASLSGKVVQVEESPIYGKTVTIEHTNGIKTEYQSLGTVKVKVDDLVIQGDIIGTSGENEYDISAGNHLHFKVSINNKYVDPYSVFGKETNKVS